MKFLINGLIVASAIAVGVLMTQGSWHSYAKLNSEAKAHTEQMNAAEATRLKKLDEASHAETSLGHEEKAREDGYLGKRELAVGTK